MGVFFQRNPASPGSFRFSESTHSEDVQMSFACAEQVHGTPAIMLA
jgi:hypothetical protein